MNVANKTPLFLVLMKYLRMDKIKVQFLCKKET